MTATPESYRSVTTADWGIYVMRLVMGFSFLAHSFYLTLYLMTLSGVYGLLQEAGLPGVLAYVIFVAEAATGFALILGIQVRWACVAILPILLGAIAVRAPNGWRYDGAGGGWEYPAFWTGMLIALAFLGDGPFCIWRSMTLGQFKRLRG